jgi:anti-anti-sigma regulatory factor
MNEQAIVKKISDDGSCATVTISGTLGIETAAEFRQALAWAFSEAPRVVLDMLQLEVLDMTILQTLCSACKTAAANRRILEIAGAIPACMKEMNSAIGAHMGALCRLNNDQACIFFGGEL